MDINEPAAAAQRQSRLTALGAWRIVATKPRCSGAQHLSPLHRVLPRRAPHCQEVLQLDALRTVPRALASLDRGRLALARPRLGPQPRHDQLPTSFVALRRLRHFRRRCAIVDFENRLRGLRASTAPIVLTGRRQSTRVYSLDTVYGLRPSTPSTGPKGRRFSPQVLLCYCFAAAGSVGPKPETPIFPSSRSLNFSPRCRVVPFS